MQAINQEPRFLLTFQTDARERTVVCGEKDALMYVEWHKRKGHLVSVCPVEIVEGRKYI